MTLATEDNYFFAMIANGDLNFQVAILICQARFTPLILQSKIFAGWKVKIDGVQPRG